MKSLNSCIRKQLSKLPVLSGGNYYRRNFGRWCERGMIGLQMDFIDCGVVILAGFRGTPARARPQPDFHESRGKHTHTRESPQTTCWSYDMGRSATMLYNRLINSSKNHIVASLRPRRLRPWELMRQFHYSPVIWTWLDGRRSLRQIFAVNKASFLPAWRNRTHGKAIMTPKHREPRDRRRWQSSFHLNYRPLCPFPLRPRRHFVCLLRYVFILIVSYER